MLRTQVECQVGKLSLKVKLGSQVESQVGMPSWNVKLESQVQGSQVSQVRK